MAGDDAPLFSKYNREQRMIGEAKFISVYWVEKHTYFPFTHELVKNSLVVFPCYAGSLDPIS